MKKHYPSEQTKKSLLNKHSKFIFFLMVVLMLFAGTFKASSQIALRGTATTGTSTSATVTVNKPMGVVAGDIMIANIANYIQATQTTATSSGWTLIAATDIERGRGTLLYKIATGSEPTSYTFAVTNSSTFAVGGIVAFSGVNNTTPFDVTPRTSWTTATNANVTTIPSITTLSTNTAVLLFGAAARVTSSPNTNFGNVNWKMTSPATLTELFDVGNNANSSACVGAAWATKPAVGATGNGSVNCTANDNPRLMGGIALVLRPCTGTPNVTITANDCAVPGKIRLTASGGSTYLWSTGQTSNPIDVDAAGVYSVTATTGGGCIATASLNVAQELVTDGSFTNFNAASPSFYTEYNQNQAFYTGVNTSGLYPEGNYAVNTSANSPSNGIGYHPAFYGRDHTNNTTGSRNFLMVNGSASLVSNPPEPDRQRIIWQQTVTITPNTNYYFSAWAMNLNPSFPAQLQFEVNGVLVGSVADLSSSAVPKPTSESEVNLSNWVRFYSTPFWNSGTATTAIIRIRNLNTNAGGNDFALDDISFATLSAILFSIGPNEISGTTNTTLCAGNTFNLTANLITGTAPITYSWTGPNNFSSTLANPTILNVATANAGDYKVTVKDGNGCPSQTKTARLSVTPLPIAPSVANIKQPDCVNLTGSLVLNGLPAGNWIINPGGITGNTTSATITGLVANTHNFTVTLGTCTSSPSANVVIQAATTAIWDGSGWTNGPPTIDQAVIFTGNYDSVGDLTACSFTVTNGAVVFKPNHTLKITNWVHVNGGSLTFENNASLVQSNDTAINSGNIIYERETTPLKQYDFTYWSSPVANSTLSQLATNSLFYNFNPTSNNWVYQNGATTMAPGSGYIGRAPSGLTYAPTQIVETSFVGAPNNGVINTSIIKSASAYNLIGNPYPSALDADSFIAANSSVINGTIYLWTHSTAMTNNVYTVNDYAKYNYTGGLVTSPLDMTGGITLAGKITAGQGFFVEAKTSLADGTYSAIFNNGMRVAGNNTQFFKNGASENTTTSISEGLERHRVWLSLRSPQGAYNQMLVGYVQGATNDFDSLFDGKTLAVGNTVSIYTKIGADNLSIQAKSLPFSETDTIPFAYSTTLNGELTIYLDNFDGDFTTQNLYLLDKTANILHNIKEAPYTFVTTNGNFEERFELRFTNQTLGTTIPTVTDNDIKISTANHQLEIISPAMAIKKVAVYDILGKLLFTQNDLHTNLFQTSSLHLAPQIVLVKVTLDNGQSFTKKIVIN